ncbi:MAG: hypothetical protein AUK47_01990 [Deltaproteobacteria bacterium CG2_30_63_29]|nr:MAG: hypothetical protein AUK47_01990 [Deltaproteobacteria bacterium CG2_30_63_29]PJB42375.1 MAG: hypothetical protein CO108_11775 [Deltaproteobacteria bacterium CG_4_9_14_3_um_filter_63_12]
MKPDRNYYLGKVVSGGYHIQRFLGAGAFAYVYYGYGADQRGVAIKIQYNLADDARKRFVREIKVLKQLPPNRFCVQYINEGETPEGFPFLVMEYVDGTTLKRTLKHQPSWNPSEACQFMVQLCDAFAGLHELGLAHRDVKPENIMLTRDWQVKLMDLGLVKDAQGLLKLFESEDILAGQDFNENLDKGILAGTPEYMAPEQFSDPSVEDERLARTDTMTDVYSLGLIFYEILTGNKLFPFKPDAATQADYARKLLAYLKTRTNQRDDDIFKPDHVPHPLWTIVERSLRADPKLRQRNAVEFGNDLRRYLDTGQGIAMQDEDKTSAIDLNTFLALHPKPAPATTGANQSVPRNTAPMAPIGPVHTAPLPAIPAAAYHPPPIGSDGQATMPLNIEQMRAHHSQYSGQMSAAAQPMYGAPGYGQPYMGTQQIKRTNTVLWIILIFLVVVGAGAIVAILMF